MGIPAENYEETRRPVWIRRKIVRDRDLDRLAELIDSSKVNLNDKVDYQISNCECQGPCQAGCTSGCKGGCKGGCVAFCMEGCVQGCDGACKGGCATGCKAVGKQG